MEHRREFGVKARLCAELLQGRVRQEAAIVRRKLEFLPLEVPAGLDYAYLGRFNGLPMARLVGHYDIQRDVYVGRLDVLVHKKPVPPRA